MGKTTTRKPEQFLTDSQGKRTAVVLPIEDYERLLEDLHDLAVIADRRDEETVDWEAVKARLREDGLL